MLVDINIPKLIEEPEVYNISENVCIKTEIFEKRNVKYCDVSLLNFKDNKNTFIGRFTEPIDRVKVAYRKGKILVYFGVYNNELKEEVITNVLSLYDILDDFNYACTEEEALIMFDSNKNIDFLKNKNNNIVKVDLERKKIKSL